MVKRRSSGYIGRYFSIFNIMWLIQKDEQIICSCGNDTFISMGDNFGFTTVECIKCGIRNSIVDSHLSAEKLLSSHGEDFCKVFGRVIEKQTIITDGYLIVNYLVFTEFDTKVIISAKDRLDRIIMAKDDAIRKEFYKKAGILKVEEEIINWAYIQQKTFHML